MEIRLSKLVLKDFQGGSFELKANGKNLNIYGQNTSGKTRLVSAFSWLMFGKDALGRADFEIKNIDATGEAVHGLEHSVEAELEIDGRLAELQKVFSEKWAKKRGSANKEFTGHTTSYYIDRVPIQEKDYASRIAEIAGDESRFRLLTSPTAFPALHWQKQRALLLEVCGDISDADVIASNEKLSPLPAILGKHSIDDHRKIIVARRTEINKQLQTIPVRLDEVNRTLPDIRGLDRKKAELAAEHFEHALNDARLRLQGVNTGGAIAGLTTKLAGLNADLRKLEDGHRSGSLATLNKLNQQISEEGSKIEGMRRRIISIDADLKAKRASLERLDGILVNLREQWTAVDAETMKEDPTDKICLACLRPLPPEQIEEAHKNYVSAFNNNRADRLKKIYTEGIYQKELSEQLVSQIHELEKEKAGYLGLDLQESERLTQGLSALESELQHIVDARDSLKRNSEDFSGDPARATLKLQIEDLESQIEAEREGKAQDIEKIKVEVITLGTAFSTAKTQADLFIQREQGEKRVAELMAEEKLLAREFEKLEGEFYLMDQFIRTKVSMLTEKINQKFETVRFKLFEQQINGALAEVCEITVNGVPFDSGLNNGARINAGLEIVKVLQEHYQIKVPVFADNAEAVNTLFDTGSQMIRLYVSEDKELKVEIGEAEKSGNTEVRSRSSTRRLTLSE